MDWMVVQRNAILAWTGHTIRISPTIRQGMSLAHLGNNQITGRGLVALVGPGQTYQVTLGPGDTYVAHPANVVAYSITQNRPRPYRFASSSLRFQVPNLGFTSSLAQIKFFQVLQTSDTWKGIGKAWHALRTAARRTIWGDRLFLQFHGPMTILLSSRAARVSDVLTARDVNEIADAPAGVTQEWLTKGRGHEDASGSVTKDLPTGYHLAEVGREGKVTFEKVDATR